MKTGNTQPSKKSRLRTILLGAATLFAGGLLYFKLGVEPQTGANKSGDPTTEKPQAEKAQQTDRLPTLEPNSEERNSRPPEAAIPNEAILVFDSEEAFDRFLDSRQSDFEILAANATLRSIRIRTSNPEDLRGAGANIDFNYTLLTPLPVLAPDGENGPAFENTALDFMRVPIENEDAGQGVTIAILDTGIRPHTSLEASTIESYDIGENASPSAYASHGTAVASLIAGHNGVGIAPAADLIGIRVLDTEGIGDTFSLAEGIVQAVDAGADILNMSLGSFGTNQALSNAIDYAAENGVVLVASAGNESVNALPYPAAYDSVIAVGSIDANGHPSYFSNQSNSVDVAAPGVGVYAAWNDEDWISFTGTSASAPYVSGAIAALSSELDIPASEASALLLANANDSGLPGADPQTGLGYIDLQRSLDSHTNYTDLALADIYLDPTPTQHGQYTVHITAQNRGTESIPTASVEFVLPNGVPQSIYLGQLDPGQSASHAINLTELELTSEVGYSIEANTSTGPQTSDTVSENDQKRIQLRLDTPTP
ncbi:S8 family peptidase [Pelagicoccus mobilis]|uniref:S8 family serine peptidase n=1 Tax=Pelagicoccus mobilis TaxID=415221 RepID=A0A934S3D5_9BACT|nr:S8 family serine peptidase [Pelagicoccus mobilis]MBK1880349.1 S8 family serine peptidase [Pelagicoccus mobilis]